MRLIALMAWYEENPNWLTASISSLVKLGADHLVAADGAYFLFPGGQARSGAEQHEAITELCHSLGIGLTLYTPQTVYYNNEVEKRSLMFALGETVATEGDWYYVADADERVTACPRILKEVLASTDKDAAEVTYWERPGTIRDERAMESAKGFTWTLSEQPIRKLFRAIPGLRVVDNHFTYKAGDKILWGYGIGRDIVPALDMREIKVEHRTCDRDKARSDEQRAYYRRRQVVRAELSRCSLCDAPSFVVIPANLQLREDGSIEHEMIEVCEEHYSIVVEKNRRALADKGADPDKIAKQGLEGLVPA